MIKLKNLLKEWNDTSFKKLPKRWSKNVNGTNAFNSYKKGDGLTELEKKEAYGFNSGGQIKIAHPTNQKTDFEKPTVVHISKKEMDILHNDGRLETDGLTIIYEK
tara:strand:+ start:212 stop:526 length:315 start_codon:yes stop_codon:yes gene_type:complete